MTTMMAARFETTGTFPNTRFRYIPTLCNHCDNAPCVNNCPTTAMYKSDDGLTLHAADKCIGCRLCQLACPYGVIYFNEDAPFENFREDDEPAIPEGTATGPDVIAKTETPIPDYNPEAGVRTKGIVEKCTFCSHRLAEDKLPWCVESCPAGARIFGDLDDPDSKPSKLIRDKGGRTPLPEKNTKPKVYYVNWTT